MVDDHPETMDVHAITALNGRNRTAIMRTSRNRILWISRGHTMSSYRFLDDYDDKLIVLNNAIL